MHAIPRALNVPRAPCLWGVGVGAGWLGGTDPRFEVRLYKEGVLRTCSAPYSLDDLDDEVRRAHRRQEHRRQTVGGERDRRRLRREGGAGGP